MYKTGHGWVAALTRFLKFLSFKVTSEVEAGPVKDPDALKNDDGVDGTTADLKGMAALTTVIGAGVAGVALLGNRALAAAQSISTINSASFSNTSQSTTDSKENIQSADRTSLSASTSMSVSLSLQNSIKSGSTSNVESHHSVNQSLVSD